MFIVYETSTGRAVSYGTVVANPLPAGLSSFPVPDADRAGLRDGSKRWDAATLTIVAVPPDPTVTNNATISARAQAHIDALKLIKNTTGTLTGAQLSNAARALAAAELDLLRVMFNKLDAVD